VTGAWPSVGPACTASFGPTILRYTPALISTVRPRAAAYEALAERPEPLLLLPRRLELASEFVTAVEARARGSGVLLSGPNGVGKSGVGLLAYLMCAARRLPAVYLSSTAPWVDDAQRGDGDAFLLSAMWVQNADLIAASAPLRRVFSAALRDEADAVAFTPTVMKQLRSAVHQLPTGFGVILDEVQHITAAVQRGDRADTSTPATVTAGTYFRHNWHDWANNLNNVFARMSIASAHGDRDFKLPAGEHRRLRIVEPLTDSQREALQSHPASPAYVPDAGARQHILYYSGNVLRSLIDAADAFRSSASTPHAVLSRRLDEMYQAMLIDCDRWLASLPKLQRKKATAAPMALVSGRVSWRSAKALFDAGIVYRTSSSGFLRPVSAAASAAFLVTAAEANNNETMKPLSSISDGRQRGFALENQVLAHLTTINTLVGSKSLDGNPAGALSLCSDCALPFDSLDEVVPRDVAVLYRPTSLTFPCDGILMPAAGDTESAIIVVECSITSPLAAARVRKVRRYLDPTSTLGAFLARFPALRRIVALAYDGELPETTLSGDVAVLSRYEPPSNTLPASSAPATRPVALIAADEYEPPVARIVVRVLDCSSLAALGVVV
jgi:hypothetical protein